MDPYVVITCKKQQKKSTVATGQFSSSPIFLISDYKKKNFKKSYIVK